MNITITDPKIIRTIGFALHDAIEMEIDGYDLNDLEIMLDDIRAYQCFDQEGANTFLLQIIDRLRNDLKIATDTLINCSCEY